MAEVADYSWARPSPAALVAAGYKGVIRYVSHDTTGKNIDPEELHALQAAGMSVTLAWEAGNQQAFSSGAAGGQADAISANQMSDALGYPSDCVIYFVLEDPNQLPTSAWPEIDAYAAAAKRSSKRPIGGYGSQAYVEHALDMGIITKGWQVGGWSKSVSPKCHLLQRSGNPVLTTMGGQLDDNLVINEDFGGW